MAQKVLIVEDEKPIAELVRFNLEKEGFQVETCYDGQDALRRVQADPPHLVILDLMLPGLDGLAVCREIRKTSQVPILMLTARADEVDRVVGLELGADDYVTKPFSPRELVARVRAILRRVAAPRAEEAPLRVADLVIDPGTYEVTKAGRRIPLSVKEFDLLRFLASRPGQIMTRQVLLDEVWGYQYFGDARTVDVTVRRLREKIEDDPANPQYVLTKRGAGYYFRKD
ncbi:MAG: response regulator [Bacillota bacterium]